MKTFVLTVLTVALLLCGAEVFPFTITTADDGELLQWPPGRTAIFYVVSSQGETAPREVVGELAGALRTWEKKSRGEVVFIYGGTREGLAAARDGINTILWVTDGWRYRPENAAISTVWPTEDGDAIEEVDIEFNAQDFDWAPPGSPGLRETALHEFGHLLGIDHSFNPGAVMHDFSSPDTPFRRALSRDDIEALMFLYPRLDRKVSGYDLPVLFYPGDFPGEPAFLSSSRPPLPEVDRWVVALGEVDFDGDGYRSELLAVRRDAAGGKALEGWMAAEDKTGAFQRIGPSREVTVGGEIVTVSGVDLNRDGLGDEVAVLLREGTGERIVIFDLAPGEGSFSTPAASFALPPQPAVNIIGMASLDANGDRIRDELLLLRVGPEGFFLHLYGIPAVGEEITEPSPGIEINVPGLQEGSRLLGMAVLDTDGDGEEQDTVLLELTPSGEYWLHSFRLVGQGDAYEISYLTSALLPGAVSDVLPARMTGLDLNRDGYFNELVIFSPVE